MSASPTVTKEAKLAAASLADQMLSGTNNLVVVGNWRNSSDFYFADLTDNRDLLQRVLHVSEIHAAQVLMSSLAMDDDDWETKYKFRQAMDVIEAVPSDADGTVVINRIFQKHAEGVLGDAHVEYALYQVLKPHFCRRWLSGSIDARMDCFVAGQLNVEVLMQTVTIPDTVKPVWNRVKACIDAAAALEQFNFHPASIMTLLYSETLPAHVQDEAFRLFWVAFLLQCPNPGNGTLPELWGKWVSGSMSSISEKFLPVQSPKIGTVTLSAKSTVISATIARFNRETKRYVDHDNGPK